MDSFRSKRDPHLEILVQERKSARIVIEGGGFSTRGSEARLQHIYAEQGAHIALVDYIVDGILCQNFEERVERFPQCRVETAAVYQRAVRPVSLEAFSHGEVFFGDPYHIKKRNVLGWLAQLHPAIATAHGFNEAVFDQGLQNLEKEKLGYRIGLRNLPDSAELSFIGGAVHEDADSVIRLAG